MFLGLEYRCEDMRLHQPHGAARGPREMARLPLGEPAATSPADHLRNQRTLPQGKTCF